MPRRPKPFVAVTGTADPRGNPTPGRVNRGVERWLAVQRPVVTSHLRAISAPDATPGQTIHRLERRYLAAVTTSGAAVGATAVVPAIGTGMTLALAGVETAAFLEATALFAQSVSEVHGLPLNNPDRARALVMAVMLGEEGSELVRSWGMQVLQPEATRELYWGEVIASTLPRAVVGPLTAKLRTVFLRRYAAQGAAGILARALPFGVGAVIGGTGNHLLGRRVVRNAQLAFGPAPGEEDPWLR